MLVDICVILIISLQTLTGESEIKLLAVLDLDWRQRNLEG